MRGSLGVGTAVLLAALLGFVSFAIFFGDGPARGSPWSRVAVAASLGALAGLGMGRLRPGAWLLLSLLSVWGAIFWGVALVAMGATGGLAALTLPALVAAACGRAGAAWGRRP